DLDAAHALAQHTADRPERVALACRFAASFARRDNFRSLGVDQTVSDRDDRFVFVLARRDTADHAPGDAAAFDAGLLVIASEDDHIAGKQRIRSRDLADARAAALLHAIPGVEVLLLDQGVHLRALDDYDIVRFGDALHQHRANAFADVLLRVEHCLH